MIRPDTGQIVLDGGVAEIDPGLTLEALPSSPLGTRAKLVKDAAGWRFFSVGKYRVGGEEFSIDLHFQGNALKIVYLRLVGPPKGVPLNAAADRTLSKLAAGDSSSAWVNAARYVMARRKAGREPVVPEDELRVAAHNHWLKSQLGPDPKRMPTRGFASRAFGWGEADSSWDHKNGDALITISYGRER